MDDGDILISSTETILFVDNLVRQAVDDQNGLKGTVVNQSSHAVNRVSRESLQARWAQIVDSETM